MLSLSNKLSLTTQPIYKFVNKYSVQFDGATQKIITDGADTVAQPTTYSFWCKSSTTGFNPVFGHGNYNIGGFSFNYDNIRPRLYLENSYWVYWNDTSAQDDGEWHHWVVYVDPNNILNSKLYVDSVLQTINQTLTTGSTTPYTESLTIGATKVTGGGSFNGKIDEFAVYDRELTQAEITRMYNTYYSPNRVANGNFAQIGNEEVTNGDFSQIGSEIITNGDFATDSNWTKDAGWSIANGVASCDGTQTSGAELMQTGLTFTNTKIYKVTYTITVNAGTINTRLKTGGSTVSGPSRTTSGTYTDYLVSTGNTTFRMRGHIGFIGSVDNISVKEVGQGFTFGDGWGMGENKAIFDATVVNKGISQEGILTSGKFYKISLDINVLSGTLSSRLRFFDSNTSGTTISNITSSGTYTFYALADKTGFQLISLSDNTAEYTVTNFTFKEVGQHWTVSNSDADNYVVFNGSTARLKFLNTSPLTQLIAQGFTLTSGKTYKLTVDVASVTSGSVKIDAVGMSEVFDTAGITTRTLQPTGNSSLSFYRNSADVDLTLNSVVIQELKHDATNLMLNHSEYQSANPLITSTKSMDFDGISDYMVANSTLGSFTGSFSCWIFFDTTGNFGYLLDARKNSGTGFIHINDTTSPVSIVNSSGTVYVDGVATINITSGKWHHVVVTGITLDITESIFFGSRHTEANYIHGKMTEVGLWDRTLTALEVASLYNQGVPTNLLVSRGDYVATGLQGYWKMGDGTNDEYPVIYDQVDPTLSSELVTNGDFSNGTTDWSSVNSVISVSNNQLTVDDTASAGIDSRAVQNIATENGKRYILRFDRISTTSVFWVAVGNGSNYSDILRVNLGSDTGAYARVFTALGTTSTIALITGGTGISVFSNVTVKEMSGNFAEMTNMVEGNITNQYPLTKIRNYYRMGDGILDGYPIIQDQTSPNLAHIPTTNLAEYSENISNIFWAFRNVNPIENSIISPDGTQNADKFYTSATGTYRGVYKDFGSSLNAAAYNLSAFVKKGGKDFFFFYNIGSPQGNNGCWFNLSTGVIGTIGAAYRNVKIESVGNDWFRCSATLNYGGTGDYVYFLMSDSNGSNTSTANGTDGIYLWGAQIEEQSQATAYLKSEGIAAVRKSSTTNILNYSEDFTQSFWTPTRCTITSNQITSPNGTLDADLLTATDTSENYIQTSNTVAVSGTSQTVSFYVKKGTSDFAHILLWDNSSNGARQWFDLTNGTIGTSTSFGSGITVNNANMISYSNDWYRCIVVFNNSTANIKTRISASNSNGSTTSTVGKTIYIWGAQLEVQTQAETYAKTTGLPVTIDLFTENNYGTMTNMSASDIVEDTP